MSFYNTCLVLFLFLTQLFVIESYAKKTEIKFVTLTAKEISALPAQKKIEYIKELRDLVEATEKTQNAFYGTELYANSNKLINQFLQYALISEAWAAETTNTCIIAGNVGILRGGRCGFTDEQKARNASCGVGKVACNPSLYGDSVCIDFVSRDDRANATAHCNEKDKDFTSVLAKYKEGYDDIDVALQKIKEEANNIFSHCIRARELKKITPDQDRTCRVLETRISKLGATACEDVRKDQESTTSVDPLLAARIKSCDEIAKASCDSKVSQLEKAAENLNKACAANGFKTNQLVSPACYPELEKCKKNGYSDKCFSSNEALEMQKIEDDMANLINNLKLHVNSAANSISSCFPSTEPKLNGSSTQADLDNKIAYDFYQKFLKLKTYDYKDDAQLRNGLSSAKGNVEDQRKYWQMYLGSVSAENERVIRAIEKRLASCNLSESEKAAALDKMSALRAYNEQMANKFRHNQDLVVKTKDNQPGMIDANDIVIKNKRDIEQWFNSSAKSGTYKACCLSPGNKGEASYLLNNKWCNKVGSGASSRIYGVPYTPEEVAGETGTGSGSSTSTSGSSTSGSSSGGVGTGK